MSENLDKLKNPFMPSISIQKWEPDKEMMESMDQSLQSATADAGAEPNQWHKNYRVDSR